MISQGFDLGVSFGLLMFITLPAWIVVPLTQDGSLNLLEASPFTILSLIGIAFFVLFFRSVKEKQLDLSRA